MSIPSNPPPTDPTIQTALMTLLNRPSDTRYSDFSIEPTKPVIYQQEPQEIADLNSDLFAAAREIAEAHRAFQQTLTELSFKDID